MLSEHDDFCCRWTIDTLDAIFTQWPDVPTALAAVPRTIVWGPTAWPAFFCQLVRDDGRFVGDCGVQAAVASNVLTARNIAHDRVSVAIESGKTRTQHWRQTSNLEQVSDAWLADELIYHEALRVGTRFWDPTEARWFSGENAYLDTGRVIAIVGQGQVVGAADAEGSDR